MKNKIYNFIKNSPWHGALTIPLLAFFIPWLVIYLDVELIENISVLDNVVAVFGLIFGLMFIIIPIWLIFGMIVSKKKLPYMLSFIAGICFVIYEASNFFLLLSFL